MVRSRSQSGIGGTEANENALVSGTEGLRFKSRACQSVHSVAKNSPPLRHFFEMSYMFPAGAMTRRWAPQIRYTLWHNTACIMKDLIQFSAHITKLGSNITLSREARTVGVVFQFQHLTYHRIVSCTCKRV